MAELEFLNELAVIRYHQRLIVQMLEKSDEQFYKLIIKYGLSEAEVHEFYQLCEKMNMELENQKAEGFVYFHPLYHQFKAKINPKLPAVEVIKACITQNIYLDLMHELIKYV
ncbi:DUF1878 family protein [Pseudoneobacillus sp. C159]